MTDRSHSDEIAAEQRFRMLVESVSDYAIYMLDPGGYIATWNTGARRFKGYAADEIIGQHYSCFFTPADRAAGLPERALATARDVGRYEGEGRRLRKDGVEIWVHVVVYPIRSTAGELLGYTKIVRDITEKRAADRALFESEQRFRMLVQGVRDYAIYMLDPDGFITNWNGGAEAIKGYSASEIIGQHFSRFYTPEDQACGEPALALETTLREGRYEREAQRVRKDGSRFWASVVIDPIRDDSGKLIGFAKITRDISEKRRAQEDLEVTRAALFQSQKLQALGELTGGIAHDFNNLMTVIRGGAELLKTPNLAPAKRDRYVDAIIETAERAVTLTQRLLAFGRRQALRPELINLGVRLDAFGEMLSRTLGSRIKVVIDVAADTYPISADAAELENALLNAAFNARDAMPDGGTITLSARNAEGEDAVCLCIADTGEGIPEALLQRVFEPFFTTKPEGKGTGLGLSQVHGFAAQSGGSAEAKSKLGEGTTIILTLPRGHRPPAAAEPCLAPPVAWDRLDVLLVEDNQHVRQFARALLEELGATVTEAADAEEADAALGRRGFDLVFSDIVMPGRSGLDLARALRAGMPKQRVLLATGYSKEVAGGEAQGFQIIRKPYGMQSLSGAIVQALSTGA